MAVACEPVPLHDVEDVEAFVGSIVVRSGIRCDREEHDELVAEGMCLLYELGRAYEPHRAGYAHAGSFAGYAAKFLPGRLRDAWHQRHEHHRYVTREDGSRVWDYGRAAMSLDELREENPEGVDAQTAERGEVDLTYEALEEALEKGLRRDLDRALRIATMKAEGRYSNEGIAAELGVSQGEVRAALERVRLALEELRTWS